MISLKQSAIFHSKETFFDVTITKGENIMQMFLSDRCIIKMYTYTSYLYVGMYPVYRIVTQKIHF